MNIAILIFLIFDFIIIGAVVFLCALIIRDGDRNKDKKIHILENDVLTYQRSLERVKKNFSDYKAKHDIKAKYEIKQNVLIRKPEDTKVSSGTIKYIKITEGGVVYGLVHGYLENYEVEEEYIFPDNTLQSM